MQSIIEDLGLSSVEAKIYLSLIRKGPSLAGTITKETGIHRRTTYDVLYRLRSKGLVSNIVIGKKRYFEAVNPDRLLDIVKEKESSLKSILPELKGIYKSSKTKNEVLFFKGKKALKTIFDDQIKESKEILFIGKGVEFSDIIRIYFSRFDLKRIEKKINIKMIFDEKARILPKKIPLSEIKYVEKWNKSTMSAYIYGENVTLVVWKDEPIFILIREKDVADGFRNYFNILWNIAKK